MAKKGKKSSPPKKEEEKAIRQEKENLKKRNGFLMKFLKVLGSVILTLISVWFGFYLVNSNPGPIYKIDKGRVTIKETIIIIAKSSAAEKKKDLDIRWEGVVIKQKAEFKGDKKLYKWEFNVRDLPEKYKEEGKYKLEVGYDGKFYEVSKIDIIPELLPVGRAKFSLELSEKIKLGDTANFQAIPNSFCVTENNIFLFPDHQTGTIKVFEKNDKFLRYIKEWGDRMFNNEAPNRYIYCSYSQNKSRLGVIDNGKAKKVLVFERSGKFDFVLIKTFDCKSNSYDMGFTGDSQLLVVSGFLRDTKNKPFDLYSIDIESGDITHLLDSHEKYHLKNVEEYLREYRKKQTLPAIGIKAFIDILDDDVFFIWESFIRIIKFNLPLLKITTDFGFEPPAHFTKVDEKKITKAYIEGDRQKLEKLRKKRAYVRDIFVTSGHVFVIYETGKNDKNKESMYRLQTYTPEGDFLGDFPIDDLVDPDEEPGLPMWLDKENYDLYALSGKTGGKKGEFSIFKYKIEIKK